MKHRTEEEKIMNRNMFLTMVIGLVVIAAIALSLWGMFAKNEPKVIKIYKETTPIPKSSQRSVSEDEHVHPHPHTDEIQRETVLDDPSEFSTIDSVETTLLPDVEAEKTADWTVAPSSTSPQPDVWEDPNTDKPQLTQKEQHLAKLLKSHGDIPEVHMFIDIYYRMKGPEPITMDEMLTMQELLYFFSPTEANRRGVEDIRALRAEASGDTVIYNVDNLPPHEAE